MFKIIASFGAENMGKEKGCHQVCIGRAVLRKADI